VYRILIFALLLAGCGSGGSTVYTIENNGTIPLEANETIVLPQNSNVESVTIGNDAAYIVCSDQAVCNVEVSIGDNYVDNGMDDNSINTTNSNDNSVDDNSVIDNSVIDNSQVVTNNYDGNISI